MKIAMINGSPKSGKSTSGILIKHLEEILNNHDISIFNINRTKPSEKDYENICNSDSLVFVFPLYIDSIPSHLLRLLIELEIRMKNCNKNIHVYCIVSNGFYEGSQNLYAIEVIKNWCKRTGVIFGQALGNGAGEMLPLVSNIPMGYGPNKNIGDALKKLSSNIVNNCGGETMYVVPNWPRLLWRIQSTISVWHPRAKANGIKRKEIRKRL